MPTALLLRWTWVRRCKVDAMDIEIAAVPREFPQFGKSLKSIARKREIVFCGRETSAVCIPGSDRHNCACRTCKSSIECNCMEGVPHDHYGESRPGYEMVATSVAAEAWRKLLNPARGARGRVPPHPVVGIESVIEAVRVYILRNGGRATIGSALDRVPSYLLNAMIAGRAIGLISSEGVSPGVWGALAEFLARSNSSSLLRDMLAMLPDSIEIGWDAQMAVSVVPDQWCGNYDASAWFFPCPPTTPSCIWRFLRSRGADLTFGECKTDRVFFICGCVPKTLPGFWIGVSIALILLLAPEAAPLIRAWQLRIAGGIG